MKIYHYRSCMFLALSFLAVLSARADNVFTGPGLWMDGTKWSGGVPKSSSTTEAVIHGLCGVTNETEIVYGPNKWTAIGDRSDSGRTAGRLDVNNSSMRFPGELDIGGDSAYFHEGGQTNYMAKLLLGYGSGYQSARVHMKGVDYVYAGAKSTFGHSAPADGGFAEYIQEGGCFNARSWDLKNKARMSFKDAVLTMSGADTISGGSVFSAENCAITNTTSEAIKVVNSTLALTNCTLTTQKQVLGSSAGSFSTADFSNVQFDNTFYVKAASAANSTCLWTMADCVWTNRDSNAMKFGAGSNSFAIVSFRGNTLIDFSKVKSSDRYISLCEGRDSCVTIAVEDMKEDDRFRLVNASIRFSAAVAGSHPRLLYRNIEGPRAFALPTPSSTVQGTLEFDNAHYSAGSSAYFGQNNRLNIVLNNNAVFENYYAGQTYFGANTGEKIALCATNSAVYINGTSYVKTEKGTGDFTFTFYDSDAGIATNSTWYFVSDASSTGRLIVDGTNGTNVVRVYTLNLGNGTNDIHLCGNTLCVNTITRSGGNDQQRIHFNGGALRSRSAQETWFPAGLSALVEEGGAVFDVRHNITVPGVLRHGGAAAKDGGVVKKGSATLTLSSSTQEFTGDIVVLDGTLVMMAVSGYTLAAGQKIGGSGTLKVGSGFTAGGVRFDGTWTDGLTVGGNVSFAPGSTVDVTGVTKKTERKRFTILSAAAVSGAENLSAAGMPDGWKLRVTDKSVSIVRDDGFIFVIR